MKIWIKWINLLIVFALGAFYIYSFAEKTKDLKRLRENFNLLKQRLEGIKRLEENLTDLDYSPTGHVNDQNKPINLPESIEEVQRQLNTLKEAEEKKGSEGPPPNQAPPENDQNKPINLPESIEETQRQLDILKEFKKSFNRYVATPRVTPKMTLELYDEFEALPDLCACPPLKEHLVILLLNKTTRYKNDIDEAVLHIFRQQFNVCPHCNGAKALICSECNGTGKCSKCDGTGIITESSTPKLCTTYCCFCKGKKTLQCRHCSNTGLNIPNLKESSTKTTNIISLKLNTLIKRLNDHKRLLMQRKR